MELGPNLLGDDPSWTVLLVMVMGLMWTWQVLALAFFAPTIAAVRWRRHVRLVFAINFLLGWSGISWVVAFVVAARGLDRTTPDPAPSQPSDPATQHPDQT